MQHVINEDLMFDRHRRLRENPEVSFEFTTDPALLHQYYLMRSIHLSKVLPVPVSEEPDAYDKRSDIMVVRVGKQVVGGARILVRRNPQDPALYIERGNWMIPEILPELELNTAPYCEISKMFLLEEFQNSEVVKGMYQCIVNRFNELGIKYGFATSSPAAARVHRRAVRGTGANCHLLHHIDVPVDGPERADNRSFQILVIFDTMSVAPKAKQDLLEKSETVKHRAFETA